MVLFFCNVNTECKQRGAGDVRAGSATCGARDHATRGLFSGACSAQTWCDLVWVGLFSMRRNSDDVLARSPRSPPMSPPTEPRGAARNMPSHALRSRSPKSRSRPVSPSASRLALSLLVTRTLIVRHHHVTLLGFF